MRILKEYIGSIKKTNELILSNVVTNGEVERFSKSDYRWADGKVAATCVRKFKKGGVYQFEFGKNYSPEMSYEHRGLIIGVNKKLLYVLPIYVNDTMKMYI